MLAGGFGAAAFLSIRGARAAGLITGTVTGLVAALLFRAMKNVRLAKGV